MMKWKKPCRDTFKANWNFVVDGKNKKLGLGVVVRDAGGEVIAAYCNVLVIFSSQIEAELSALWSVLKFAEIGLNNVILEETLKEDN